MSTDILSVLYQNDIQTLSAMLLLSILFFFNFLAFSSSQAVSLNPSGNVTFCPGDIVNVTCRIIGAPLVWETSSELGKSKIINDATDTPGNLGIFHLSVHGVRVKNNVVVDVNSSATTLAGLQPDDDGVTLSCREADTFQVEELVIRLAGLPPAPAVDPITVVDRGSVNSTFILISWSESNCAVQYVVAIVNPSDDRVYSNITTSNTNTTVTLPTGVEFCVILVAVDTIGRRGPDTTPVCYSSTNDEPITTTILSTEYSATTPTSVIMSPTVTHSPVMMGGVIVVAIAIPIVLVLLIVGVMVGTVAVCVLVYVKQKRSLQHSTLPYIQWKKYKTVQVLNREVDVNSWEIMYAIFWKKDHLSLKEQFEKGGYTAYDSTVDVRVTADDDVAVTVKGISANNGVWIMENVMSEMEHEGKPHFATQKFQVSSTHTSPNDLCLPMTVTLNGTETQHTISFRKNASKRCVCQVFYYKEGFNCWKITFAFFFEHLLETVKQIYQDVEDGPTAYFYLCDEIKKISLSPPCKTDKWNMSQESLNELQVYRAALEGYTGEGEPPICQMTLTATDDNPIDLSLPVNLNGVRKGDKILQIKRPAEDPNGCVCKVFYDRKGDNHWTATLAFCQKNKLDKVIALHKDEESGSSIDIIFAATSYLFYIVPNIVNVTEGWEVHHHKEHYRVSVGNVIKYTGEGDPPFCEMTLKAVKTPLSDLEFDVFLNGVKSRNNVFKLARKAEYFQATLV